LKRFYIFSLISLVTFSCSSDSKSDDKKKDKVLPAVEAVQAQSGSLPLSERFSGKVKAKNQIEIYPEISAPVIEVAVENGEFVNKGDILVKLRAKDFQERLKQTEASYNIAFAQMKQSEARLNEIKSNLNRTRKLSEQNLTSAAELEEIETRTITAQADLDLAKARVDQAKANMEEETESLNQTIVRSPISGVVGNRDAEIGMIVTPNRRLFTLGQLDEVKIEIVLTDRMLSYLEVGQTSEIYTDNLTQPGKSKLSRISPFLNPITQTTIGEIDFKNTDNRLKSGMFVSVDVNYGESEKATLVPLSALYEDPITGATGVFVYRDEIQIPIDVSGTEKENTLTDPINFEFVEVDIIAKGRMEVGISGVDENDWIVTIGQELLVGSKGVARVRPVSWDWIRNLQNLQRDELLEEIMNKQQNDAKKTSGTLDSRLP
jgi:HlyD family secretion protein